MIRNKHNQSGQTLIETVVAVFILVMGITASLGLANYSLNATSNVRKQIIAIGLAREGIEAVKNMRDTNWLQTTLNSDCYNYSSTDNTAFCYKLWLDPVDSGGEGYGLLAGNYVLNENTGFNGLGYWSLAARANNFGLNYDSTNNPVHGLYSSWTPVSHASATSDFARKVTISYYTAAAPFNDATIGPRVLVTVQVWWKDRKCPTQEDAVAGNPCMITLQTYLTNWKDF